ncbi:MULTISPECIES: ParD-like family protein [unclassified Pseudomonas]|uniref:ParD-like family protein n=1 Tax=unclassified Pseudomonas TaxID=196821 RepID=UPI002AC9AA2F|nr:MULTISPECIES: ParD-like family protein [unclassified Pseudomonas]MEB0039839.1 ParD-like family protein [Pseudomonas sp. MH10]MEB0077219.1 ParD-like family protein [Pseudomonas sp. MH10out]MEB0091450.1 ParD-like family protein [Pseudomonas sp. CCI4.2]MEB0101566.1 ParD-like family protein [Pseudomonas sp. CCI3.2]MEB0120677.1 ParD-like family protein [Pseudomonas sp. CCI1.2]
MGLVKISEQMHANARAASAALSRSINAQAEHWMKVGMMAELHPALNYSDICQLLIRAEHAGGSVLSATPFDLSAQTGQSQEALQ